MGKVLFAEGLARVVRWIYVVEVWFRSGLVRAMVRLTHKFAKHSWLHFSMLLD